VNQHGHEKPTRDLSYISAMMEKPQDLNKLHCKLGHVSEDAVQGMAKFYNWMLKNNFKNCRNCALAKSRQKISIRNPRKDVKLLGKMSFHQHKFH